MGDQHDDATRKSYFLARLEAADDREWNSLHLTYGDAERQLKAVGAAWAVGFTLVGEPADGFRRYAIAEARCSDRTSPAKLRRSRQSSRSRRGDGWLDVAD